LGEWRPIVLYAVSYAETSALIEMPFGVKARVSPGSNVLDVGPDAPTVRGSFEGESVP